MHFGDTYTDANAVNWYLDPTEISDEVDHFCLRAKILCDAPNHDNDYENYVQSNVHHVLVDSDEDGDWSIDFRAANFHSKKRIPVDIRVDHTLPAGAVITAKEDWGELRLKPGEERTIGYQVKVPGRALSELRPPFNCEIKGKLHGELCGRFRGNVSELKYDRRRKRFSGLLAGDLLDLGTVTGRMEAQIDLDRRSVKGRAIVRFTPFSARMKGGSRAVGVRGELDPVRIVNFTQLVEGEAVGGVTVRLVTKR